MKSCAKILTLTTVIITVAVLLSNCDNKKKHRIEQGNSGTVNVYCDEAYFFVMDSVFKMYQARNKNVELTVNFVNARNAKSQLLGGQTQVAILGRDNLADEDSLMQLYNVEPHLRMDIANDGLVFFTQADFPIDTLNDAVLLQVFTENKNLKNLLPNLNSEPEFVIANQNSSEYGNFINLVCQRKSPTKQITLLPNSDSVIKYVQNNPNAIGICYLSQVQGQFFKLLRIGYTDATGNYVRATKVPHQSFIVMGEYPYITTLRLYLLENRTDLIYTPFWFGTFVEKDTEIVRFYQQKRLVPTFATFTLEDERRPTIRDVIRE